MQNQINATLFVGLLAGLLITSFARPTTASTPVAVPETAARTPVLLELFTSEGCSSCPPADKLLQSLDQTQPVPKAELIVLSEHVDYWNNGGWSDPYSSPEFSQRQQAYAEKLHVDSVYTPQLVVDGTAELVGSNASQARAAIDRAITKKKADLQLTKATREGDRIVVHVQLEPLPKQYGKATIFLAVADNLDQSHVARGENARRSLSHVAVVRTLTPVGTAGSQPFSGDVSVPVHSTGQSGLRIVAFVQDQSTRKILAVAQQKLS